MAFLAICTAIWDYTPQAEGELPITEGELLYILEKSDEDDWWKAKKKAENEDEEEPIGLIPNNYVKEAEPTHQAKALFDYSRQTEEELSFVEDDTLLVYDTSDPDWTLVGLSDEYGFVPANYIESVEGEERGDQEEDSPVASPPLPARPPAQESSKASESPKSQISTPAANIAGILGGHVARTPIAPQLEREALREPSEEEAPPPMPARPNSESIMSPPPRELSPASPEYPQGIVESPPANRVTRGNSQSAGREGPGGYHLYNINEMVAVMGKFKKMPMTLGINLGLGVILVMPEKKRDGPQQEWTAEKLTHYSIEGKHVFLDLVKPSKSFDLHAGAKDTAEEIVAALGELAGAAKAEGLREVIAAGSGGQKKGQMLYEFIAQGDDEVTVADGDEVIILDDTLSEEWWKVRRVKNGKEGVVPSSYVEVTGLVSPPLQMDPISAALSPGISAVERNRKEEERLTREAVAASSKQREEEESRPSKRATRTDSRTGAKSKPDLAKLRTWTDRSGSFKVEAQFIGLKDGKIHLHKINGIKIAVPVGKMSITDIEYVERMTGKSLDDEKPLEDLRKRSVNGTNQSTGQTGARTSSHQPARQEYDWFDFFLKCGVSPYQCERYSYNFNKDSMDESVLPDINPTVLRNLGLKEGDILRVMKYLDSQFGRADGKAKTRNVSFAGQDAGSSEDAGEDAGSGSLFSGPGGALKNNTRKGRPAPAVQTNDNIDSKVLEKGIYGTESLPSPNKQLGPPEDKPPTPPLKDNVGFEDNAWDVKPSRQPTTKSQQSLPPARAQSATPPAKTTSPPPQKLTPGMADLSLLTQPLQPTKAVPSPPSSNSQTNFQSQSAQNQQSPQTSQQQGANPSFFNQLNSQPTGLLQLQQNQPQLPVNAQPTGQYQFNPPRQRPQAPPVSQQGSLIPPPPARPLSAPQNASGVSNFSAVPHQMQHTGMIGPGNYLNSTSPPPNLNQLQQMQSQYGIYNPSQPQFTPQQMQPQVTGFQPQPFTMNGQAPGNAFSQPIQAQQTGFQPSFAPPTGTGILPQATGVSSILPPPLQPQNTSGNGYVRSGFGQPPPPMPSVPLQFQQQGQSQQQAPPIPPIPRQSTLAPLQPQKTGPAPNVKFGIQPEAKRLAPQPTGRKANLAQATPDNPFGF